MDYFTKLFRRDEEVSPCEVVDLIEPTITNEMNEDLCKPYNTEEISDVLFQIAPLKAPGPDGLPTRFFQRSWSTFREDIIQVVQEFFRTGTMSVGVNDTCIILIPKVAQPETLKDFRHLSLCNVIYNVVSKCMVN